MKPVELSKLSNYIDIGYFNRFNGAQSRPIIRRSIKEKLCAWKLDDDYYDGDRIYGYGGFENDYRWNHLLPVLFEKCNEDIFSPNHSTYSILDIGCKKGFIVEAALNMGPNISAIGIESHEYPINKASQSVQHRLIHGSYTDLPFADNSFNFCIAFSSIYMLNIGDIVSSLREIKRVSKSSYITFGAYNELWEKAVFENWTLIGTTLLHTSEWLELFDYVGYDGYYFFTTPSILGFTDLRN